MSDECVCVCEARNKSGRSSFNNLLTINVVVVGVPSDVVLPSLAWAIDQSFVFVVKIMYMYI